MKPLFLALAIHAAPAATGSLGVGLDVLPAAYSFAASRFDFVPDLRLTRCDQTSCRWSTGHGVDLVAYVSEGEMDVKQLEIDAGAAPLAKSDDELWFRRACLSIVALTLTSADKSEVRAIADAISGAPSGAQERGAGNILFYGGAGAPSSAKSAGPVRRCGALVQTP